MLKPSATKIAAQSSTDQLVAEFRLSGNTVKLIRTGVANGLKRKRFTRKPMYRMQDGEIKVA
jgi:hypothetical protein